MYGKKEVNISVQEKYEITRQMLHSYELRAELYGKKEVFFAPIKPDMMPILENTDFLRQIS